MIHLREYLTFVFSAVLVTLAMQGVAYEVNITTAKGEEYVLEFQPEETFQSVVETVNHCLAEDASEEKTIRMDFSVAESGITVKAYGCKAPPRNYNVPLSSQEKKDLTFILKTLANNSLVKIAKEKSNLKKAGDRIDNLHPFKFLEAVFTDEELKVCIRNIEGKSWVWTEFRDGLTSSLAKEAAAGNLKPEYIQSLAQTLNIDINSILPTIQDKNWSKLVTDLIAIVPRSGDSNRYNM